MIQWFGRQVRNHLAISKEQNEEHTSVCLTSAPSLSQPAILKLPFHRDCRVLGRRSGVMKITPKSTWLFQPVVPFKQDEKSFTWDEFSVLITHLRAIDFHESSFDLIANPLQFANVY